MMISLKIPSPALKVWAFPSLGFMYPFLLVILLESPDNPCNPKTKSDPCT